MVLEFSSSLQILPGAESLMMIWATSKQTGLVARVEHGYSRSISGVKLYLVSTVSQSTVPNSQGRPACDCLELRRAAVLIVRSKTARPYKNLDVESRIIIELFPSEANKRIALSCETTL